MSANMATALALLAALVWCTGTVAQKTILAHLDLAHLDLARGIGSLCILLAVVIAARIPARLPEGRALTQAAQP
jgi:hypothetical protein